MALSQNFLLSYARRTKRRMFVSLAKDKLGGGWIPRPRMRLNLWNLQDGQTQFHAGKLLLVEGMELVLRINIHVSGNVVNGSQGTLLSIILDDRENKQAIEATPIDQPYYLDYQPTCLLVHFPTSRDQLEGFPPGVIPIYPMTKEFQHSTTVRLTPQAAAEHARAEAEREAKAKAKGIQPKKKRKVAEAKSDGKESKADAKVEAKAESKADVKDGKDAKSGDNSSQGKQAEQAGAGLFQPAVIKRKTVRRVQLPVLSAKAMTDYQVRLCSLLLYVLTKFDC